MTYEFILDALTDGSEWPYKGKPAWVLTSRDLPEPDGEDVDVRIANAGLGDLHDEIMAAAGERNLWVVGGGNVASQFADEGLLDEVLVTIVPVVLGEGKPLFARRLPGGPMQLMARPPSTTAWSSSATSWGADKAPFARIRRISTDEQTMRRRVGRPSIGSAPTWSSPFGSAPSKPSARQTSRTRRETTSAVIRTRRCKVLWEVG